MRKKIFGLAFIAMSMIALPIVAQVQSKSDDVRKENAQCINTSGKSMKCRALEGLNLTDAQKEQLKQIGEKRRTAIKEQMQQKQRNDSVGRAGRSAAKKAYLDDVKSVLTPEQYVTFLENHFVNASGSRGGKAIRAKHKGKKMSKGKGVCCQPVQSHGESR